MVSWQKYERSDLCLTTLMSHEWEPVLSPWFLSRLPLTLEPAIWMKRMVRSTQQPGISFVLCVEICWSLFVAREYSYFIIFCQGVFLFDNYLLPGSIPISWPQLILGHRSTTLATRAYHPSAVPLSLYLHIVWKWVFKVNRGIFDNRFSTEIIIIHHMSWCSL